MLISPRQRDGRRSVSNRHASIRRSVGNHHRVPDRGNRLHPDRPVPVGPGRQSVRPPGRLPPRPDRTRPWSRAQACFLIPIVDRPVKVDLREQFIEVPSQTTITKDNAPINIDFLIYWRIVDPLRAIVNVADFAGALQGIATTTLRAVIGDILLDDVLSKRDQINEVLRAKLDEQTERWGGKVTTVEIREIIPPRDVQEAMNRMLSAERNRRAVITESEGTRQANINVAEGEKQAAILRAEGKRQAAILEAEGFSQALERIFDAAHTVDEQDHDPAVPRGAQGARRSRHRPSSSSRSSSPSSRTRIGGYAEARFGQGGEQRPTG